MDMYINGEWCASSSGETLNVVNPATEAVIGTVPNATEDDVNRAVAAAKEAFKTIDEAIELVNSSRYGLGAVIMSTDMKKIKQFFEDVKACTIWVNNPLPDNVGGPFGGMKESGFGDFRELGEEGLEAFMETKHVHWTFDPRAIQENWFGEEV